MATEKWEDQGNNDVLNFVTFGLSGKTIGHDRLVKNTETRELKTVYVAPGQKLGDAIAKGQGKK